jgi:hypothetical protein
VADEVEAFTVTFVLLDTTLVKATALPLVDPAAAVIEAGSGTAVLELESAIFNPPEGAGAFKEILSSKYRPPSTVVGAAWTSDTPAGATVRAVETWPPDESFAVIVTELRDVTGSAEIVKLADVAPPPTRTYDGIDTKPFDAERYTTVPPEGAGPLRCTRLSVNLPKLPISVS